MMILLTIYLTVGLLLAVAVTFNEGWSYDTFITVGRQSGYRTVPWVHIPFYAVMVLAVFLNVMLWYPLALAWAIRRHRSTAKY